jgi:tRNA A37 threonylcarbamoyladenosine biosynthesis protein TsaE
MGALTVSADSPVVTRQSALANGISLVVAYTGGTFDPAHCDIYTALAGKDFALATTRRKQTDAIVLDWPGDLSPPETAENLTLRVNVVYTEGRQSVAAQTSVTITP